MEIANPDKAKEVENFVKDLKKIFDKYDLSICSVSYMAIERYMWADGKDLCSYWRAFG